MCKCVKICWRYFSGLIEQLIRDFSLQWKNAIESLNQDVMRSFSNFKNGNNILQVNKLFNSFFIHKNVLKINFFDAKKLDCCYFKFF